MLYLASIFGNFSHINASNIKFVELSEDFIKNGFIANNQKYWDSKYNTFRTRFIFIGKDENYKILFCENRIDIRYDMNMIDYCMEKKVFVQTAITHFQLIFEMLSLSANRLALVTDELINIIEENDKNEVLKKIY